jgi:hypothetical protein
MTSPTANPAAGADLSGAWDRLIQYLMGLSPEAQADALAHPGDTLDAAGLGDVDAPSLNNAIVNSGSFNREYNIGNQSNSSGEGVSGHGAVASPPPPPDCSTHAGESGHAAAERVMNYYINNTYSEVIDQSTNIGQNFGTVAPTNVAGNGNQTVGGVGNTTGDLTQGDGNLHGDHSAIGDHNATGDGSAVLDHSAVGEGNTVLDHSDGNATGAGSVALGGGSVGGNVNTGAGAQVGDGSAFGTGSAAGHGTVNNNGVQGDGNTTGFGSGSVNSGTQDASHGGAISTGSGDATSNNTEDNSTHDSHDDNSTHDSHDDNSRHDHQTNDSDNDSSRHDHQDNSSHDDHSASTDTHVDTGIHI